MKQAFGIGVIWRFEGVVGSLSYLTRKVFMSFMEKGRSASALVECLMVLHVGVAAHAHKVLGCEISTAEGVFQWPRASNGPLCRAETWLRLQNPQKIVHSSLHPSVLTPVPRPSASRWKSRTQGPHRTLGAAQIKFKK